MSEDSINALIGTFSRVDESTLTDFSMNQCICIDTSTNRIGINTLNPEYSIDISNVSNISTPQYIRTPRLIISDISKLPLTYVNETIIEGYILAKGEVYVDASNYLRHRY
jgi:hypothetical protein